MLSLNLSVETVPEFENEQPTCLLDDHDIILTCNGVMVYPRPTVIFRKNSSIIVPESTEVSRISFDQVRRPVDLKAYSQNV